MIDLELVDRLFEVGRTTGAQVQFRIFDKRVLLPLPQLLDAASHAAEQTISEAELRIMAGQGWVPLLRGAGDDGTEEGAPLYAPERIGLFVKLQQQGYSTDELRLIAEYEEAVIDDIVTVDDLAYADDDLDTLLLYAEARIDALEHGWREDSKGVRIDSTADLERARREVRFLQGLQAKGVPDHLREKVEKHAFRVRALNEMFRLHLVEIDRAKLTAGYSPGVVCESHSWSPTEGFKAGRTMWEPTVKSALACSGDSSEIPAIRVPGFLLRGDRVISTKTLRPGEYAQRWKEQDLDGYLECWLRLRGDRRCLNCLTALSEASDERKQFCSDKCRNAAKQRRHREHNPDSVERAHRKYWQSLDS